jgi:DNA-binding GntR family transcriptional regulator
MEIWVMRTTDKEPDSTSARELARDGSRLHLDQLGPLAGSRLTGELGVANFVTTSVSTQAYRHIKRLLVDGRLKPGTRISFRETAMALGIGVTPLREALLQLATEQSLVAGRGRTIEVPRLEAGRCRELWEIRLLLEPRCAEIALGRVTPAAIARLEKANAEMLAANQDRDIDRGIRFNREFHFQLYEAAQTPMLTWIIECVWAQVGAYVRRLVDHHVKKRSDVSIQGPHIHATILQAVRQGDAAALTRGVRRDLIEVRDGILQLLAAGGDAGQGSAATLGGD